MAVTGLPFFELDVVRRVPHDVAAYTQGFATAGTALYESTGKYGRSQLRELDVATGRVRRSRPLRADLFGEGIAVVDDTIWQLTWREGVALVWDRDSLTLSGEVPFDGEGWGLCFDGEHLVHSDGTDVVRFRDPFSFAEERRVPVTLDGKPLPGINDLTFLSGQLWANVLLFDSIFRIDPVSGAVTGIIDGSRLLTRQERATSNVLNGITSVGSDLIVSGKLWPHVFQVRCRQV